MRQLPTNALRNKLATCAIGLLAACGSDATDEHDGVNPTPPITPTLPDGGGEGTHDTEPPEVPDAGRAPLACVGAGASCNPAPCCSGNLCVHDKVRDVNVCAGECLGDNDCMSHCCILVEGGLGHACAPADYCASSTPPPTMTPGMPVQPVQPPQVITKPAGCGALRIVAADGTYLGLATSDQFGADSVCNEFGTYGSKFQTNSIFNEFGTYGSEFQTQSAYSQFTSTPPALVCPGPNTIIGYVTKGLKAPAVDPDNLCATLAANGL